MTGRCSVMALLSDPNLGIAFGGFAGVDKVDLRLKKGGLWLTWPEWPGKTTVFNTRRRAFISRRKAILLFGRVNITGQPPAAIKKAGIARTFQNIRLFKDMTVRIHARVGLHNQRKYSSLAGVFRLPAHMKKEWKCVAKQCRF